MIEGEHVHPDLGIGPDEADHTAGATLHDELDQTGSVEGPPVPTPSKRWNLIIAVLIVLLLVGAGALVLRSHADQRRAAAARVVTADLEHQKDGLAQQADQSEQSRHAVATAAALAHAALLELTQALDDVTTSQNKYTDVSNRAADLYNGGKIGASRDLLKGEGATALADLQQKVAALDKQLTDAQAKADELQQATHV